MAISHRTLQAWHRAYHRLGPERQILGVAGLIDRRGACTDSDELAGRSPDAIAYFYALYHTQSRHSVKTCHRHTLAKAREDGWRWSPSYSATRKWLNSRDNLALSYCCAWTPERDNRRFIGRLECNKPISPFTPIDQLRDALASVNRARKDVSRGSRSAAQSTRTAAQELRARRRKQAVALKATGTDDHRPNIEVVQTGFDTSSNIVQTPSESAPAMTQLNTLTGTEISRQRSLETARDKLYWFFIQ